MHVFFRIFDDKLFSEQRLYLILSGKRLSLADCRQHPDAAQVQRLYDLYQRRLIEYEKSPPPVDWDGVYLAPAQKVMSAA